MSADSEDTEIYEASPRVGQADYFDEYLDKIQATPILSAPEERSLAKTYALGKGDVARAIYDHLTPPLAIPSSVTPEQRKELEQRNVVIIRNNDRLIERALDPLSPAKRAKDRLIEHTLRWAVTIARRYTAHNVPLEDLVQAASVGLQDAVENFNYLKGVRVTTYSHLWIKQAVFRCTANEGRGIRIPINMVERSNIVRRERARLALELGYVPSDDELSDDLKDHAKKIYRLTPEQISELEEFEEAITSLDTPTGSDGDHGGNVLLDFQQQPSFEEQEEADGVTLPEFLSRDAVHSVLACLPERTRIVLVARKGLYGDEPMTLDKVSEKIGLSRETVRLIEREGIKQLLKAPEVLALRQEIIGDL